MKHLIRGLLGIIFMFFGFEIIGQNKEQNLGLRLGYSFQLGGDYGKMTDYYNGSNSYGFPVQDEIVKPTFANGLNVGISYDYFFDKVGVGLDLGFLQGTGFEEQRQIKNTSGAGYIVNRYEKSQFYRFAPSLLLRNSSRASQNYFYIAVGPIINAGSFEQYYESEDLPQNDKYTIKYSSLFNLGFTSTLSYRKQLKNNFNLDFGIRYEHLNFVPKRSEYLEFYRDGEKLELTKLRRVTIYVDEISGGEPSASEPGEALKVSFPLSNISFFVRASITL